VVNQALVRKSFPNQNPPGRTIFCSFDTLEGMTIVGVVGDVRQLGPEREPMPECYMTYGQHGFNGLTLSIIARTTGDPTSLSETLRRLARQRAADVPMKFTTMEAMLSDHVATPRFRTLLVAIFASLAVCLAMAGVYGVMAHSVAQRTGEIGVRIALGASADAVLRLVLGRGMILAGLGLTIGLAAARAAGRVLASLLFQVQPSDPTTLIAVAVLLGVVVLPPGDSRACLVRRRFAHEHRVEVRVVVADPRCCLSAHGNAIGQLPLAEVVDAHHLGAAPAVQELLHLRARR
jgi:hypothetical protein